MSYIIFLVVGMIGGAVVALAYLWDWRKKVQRQVREADLKIPGGTNGHRSGPSASEG